MFNKFILDSTQKSEKPEWSCAYQCRRDKETLKKKANAVDRANNGEYNRDKILEQYRLAIGQKLRTLKQTFYLDEDTIW